MKIILLVNGLGKIFAWPGATSSWMHGSLTTNGLFLDQRSNDLFAFATYQEMIKELKDGNKSVIHDLSYKERYVGYLSKKLKSFFPIIFMSLSIVL